MDGMDLVEFLRARFTDDEEAASGVHGAGCDSRYMTHSGGFPCDCPWPARIAAECESKRRIVELHKLIQAAYPNTTIESDPCCEVCSADGEYPQGYPCETLRLLALPYAGHADYRPEWDARING